MIKFFRKIRQKLLSENKFSKYLIYAIGEIVLVVIGILIALGINNWNENNKTQQVTNDYLERLLTETQINLDKVEKEIEIEQNQINASKKILDMFHQERKSLRSKTIDSLISIVFSANAIDINSGIFTEGINSGKIGNLKSEKLRTALYGFVGLAEDLKRQEQIWNNDLNDVLGVFLYKNFNYRNMDNSFGKYKDKIGTTHFKDFNNLSLLNSMEFENHIDNRFYTNNGQLEIYQNLSSDLKKIENLIKNELKK
ncbi:DUF6090 family protein [Winogradskyella maritima]|uniref:DUF6090 family protein n=1 Tax=Winogradskyella maritima TaxID=1517766 RepID=A0ABV8AJ20_9FLAO|nr:DUF6090 family protein [Winogradskyella maritima]